MWRIYILDENVLIPLIDKILFVVIQLIENAIFHLLLLIKKIC
jgi:hypothetical protein